jgi:hypothetical protein
MFVVGWTVFKNVGVNGVVSGDGYYSAGLRHTGQGWGERISPYYYGSTTGKTGYEKVYLFDDFAFYTTYEGILLFWGFPNANYLNGAYRPFSTIVTRKQVKGVSFHRSPYCKYLVVTLSAGNTSEFVFVRLGDKAANKYGRYETLEALPHPLAPSSMAFFNGCDVWVSDAKSPSSFYSLFHKFQLPTISNDKEITYIKVLK